MGKVKFLFEKISENLLFIIHSAPDDVLDRITSYFQEDGVSSLAGIKGISPSDDQFIYENKSTFRHLWMSALSGMNEASFEGLGFYGTARRPNGISRS